MIMFPSSIEEYVPKDDPVRAYDVFIEKLDLETLGIEFDESKIGNPAYHPRIMLKLLVYGYSYGVRSSRKLEREANYNIGFMFLLDGLKPDFKTISEFRRNNRKAIANVLVQCARMCVKLGLVKGNTLFVDGTKMRANASSANNWTAARCEEALKGLEKRVKEILDECDLTDESEESAPSEVHMNAELADKRILEEKIRGILNDLRESGKNAINTTDADSRRVLAADGFMTGYNAQLCVDGENGLLVNADIVESAVDMNQLSGQVQKANESVGIKYDTVVADAGYHSVRDLKKIEDAGTKVVVPSPHQVSGREEEAHGRDEFKYDAANDCYICPEGRKLVYYTTDEKLQERRYRIEDAQICKDCKRYGTCTTAVKFGRTYRRMINGELFAKLEIQYRENRELFRQRRTKSEGPFGHIKKNLGARQFLLRGMEGVKAEMAMLATAFNLTRVMRIMGVEKMVFALKAM
jgi:transposase